MCLIIASSTGELPSKDVLSRAWDGNPHGWGIMRHQDGRLQVSKGLTRDGLDKEIASLKPGNPYVIHYRWATHGPKTEDNCHPFEINSKLYMAHNGVISGIEIEDPLRSDSYHFATKLADLGLGHEELESEDVRQALADWIGWYNKLVFMDLTGRITIINEDAGEWQGAIWYSNDLAINEARYWEDEARYLRTQLEWVRSEYEAYKSINY